MSSEADIEQDDWHPPTEAEMKVLQARRERSDKISKLMGDYLLKGYRMLGVCCQQCDTILLQDKQGTNYCVACQELDADNVKDDPALSDQAALRQAAEHSQRMSRTSDKHNRSADATFENTLRMEQGEASAAGLASGQVTTTVKLSQVESCPPDLTRNTPTPALFTVPCQESSSARPKVFMSQASHDQGMKPSQDSHVMSHALCVLYQKLQMASDELSRSDNVNNNTALCQLIKHCAEAIEAVKKLQQHN